jgi:hypothetical protein
LRHLPFVTIGELHPVAWQEDFVVVVANHNLRRVSTPEETKGIEPLVVRQLAHARQYSSPLAAGYNADMKLISQKSDERWRADNTRYHSLNLLAARGDIDVDGLCDLSNRVNADSYGGIEEFRLLVVNISLDLDKYDHNRWNVQVVIVENALPWNLPLTYLTEAGELAQLTIPRWTEVDFRNVLPRAADFPAALTAGGG